MMDVGIVQQGASNDDLVCLLDIRSGVVMVPAFYIIIAVQWAVDRHHNVV